MVAQWSILAVLKNRLGIKTNRPLADFLPTLTIAAKNLATEITNHNVDSKNLLGELSITNEHVQNNKSVRKMLVERGIRPEELLLPRILKNLNAVWQAIKRKLKKQQRNYRK